MENVVHTSVNNLTDTFLIELRLESHTPDCSLDYVSDIDETGAIVFTPVSPEAVFTSISGTEEIHPSDIVQDTTRIIILELTCMMISDTNNFEWTYGIDPVGQAVILPIDPSTLFTTISINDSLNLVTEVLNEADTPSDDSNIDNTEGETTNEIATENNDSTPEPEKRAKVVNVSAKVIEEDLGDTYTRDDIILGVLNSSIPIMEYEGTPLDEYIHLSELDHDNYTYYFDKESGIVVCYITDNE